MRRSDASYDGIGRRGIKAPQSSVANANVISQRYSISGQLSYRSALENQSLGLRSNLASSLSGKGYLGNLVFPHNGPVRKGILGSSYVANQVSGLQMNGRSYVKSELPKPQSCVMSAYPLSWRLWGTQAVNSRSSFVNSASRRSWGNQFLNPLGALSRNSLHRSYEADGVTNSQGNLMRGNGWDGSFVRSQGPNF